MSDQSLLTPDIRTGSTLAPDSELARFYIRTFTGKQFYFDRIEENEIDIRDIAHALAMNCRWTGHVKSFYSVAQHSEYVSKMVPAAHALAGLLHDASEAYMHDTPSPLKWHLKQQGFTAFSELETRIDKHIFDQFKLPYPRAAEIKNADLRMLATEHRDLMLNGHEMEVKYLQKPYQFTIQPWSPEQAEQEFLERYRSLTELRM